MKMKTPLEKRFTRLEQSNRRWRASCFALLLIGGVGFIIAAEQPAAPAEIIQARRIELIGPDGRAAIVLEAKADSTSLAVWGPDHQHAAVLVAQSTKSALMLMKNKDTPEVFAEAVHFVAQVSAPGRQPIDYGTDA